MVSYNEQLDFLDNRISVATIGLIINMDILIDQCLCVVLYHIWT